MIQHCRHTLISWTTPFPAPVATHLNFTQYLVNLRSPVLSNALFSTRSCKSLVAVAREVLAILNRTGFVGGPIP